MVDELSKWRDRVVRFERSGLMPSEFARREGVSPGQLAYWRKKLGGQPAASAPPSAGGMRTTALVPIVVHEGHAGEAPTAAGNASVTAVPPLPIAVVVGDGLVVRVTHGFEPGMLTDVVRALLRVRESAA